MISILLSIYNGEYFVKESINSVLDQTFEEFELLIGFNGTTDNSKKIIEEYKDKRIKIFDYGEDKGRSKTLNKLLSLSAYNYICIQDDDDIWHKDKLKIQIETISNGYDVVGTFIKYINNKSQEIGFPQLSTSDYSIKKLSFSGINQLANSSCMFKKQDAIEVCGWNPYFDGIEDFDFWLKLMRNNKIFYNIPQFLTFHRIHENSNFNNKNFDLKEIL